MQNLSPDVATTSIDTPIDNVPARLQYAVIALSALIFVPVLGGQKIWDDYFLINGSAIGGGASLLNCFTKPFLWHFFRPLVSVSFFYERMLWGGDPLGYHITNLLLHAAGTAVMMVLMREVFRSRWTTLLGGIFFAIHPVQVGAVAWIGGRTDSLSSLWVLLMAIMLVRAARSAAGSGGGMLALAVLFFNLAIYTKEQCLPILVLAPLAFRTWRPISGIRLPKTSLFVALPFVASATLFLVLGYYLGMPRPSSIPYPPSEIAAQVGRTAAYYTLLILTPTSSLMHRISLEGLYQAGLPAVLFGYAAMITVGTFLARCWNRDAASTWFLMLAALLFVPISNLLPLPFLVVAPYRAALPWIGIAALLANIIGRRIDKNVLAQRPVWPIAAGLAFCLIWHGSLSVWGASLWRSETQLFAKIASHDPKSIVIWGVYTYSLERSGKFREAAEAQETALDRLFRSGAWHDWDTASTALRKDPSILMRARQNQGTTENPHIWIAGQYAQLANCRMLASEHGEAKKILSIADKMWSNHIRVHLGIAHYAGKEGNLAEAERRYRKALTIDKTNVTAKAGLRAIGR